MKRCVQLSILIELILVSTAFAQWRIDGIQVAPSTIAAATRSDGAGGILTAWRSGSNVYVQRVDNSGTKLWNASGVVVCGATGLRYTPNVASDGAGGAFVTWLDERNGSSNRAIYVQRVSALGVPLWAPDGIAISPPAPTSSQYVPAIINDGPSGAIIAWTDNRTGDYNIYAQRVDASGATWFANGVPVCTAAQDQYMVRMRAGSSAGQALLCWIDQRDNSSAVYGQALGIGGVPQWGSNGTQAGLGDPDAWGAPVIDTDGAGGGIVTWANANMDIYAQRIVGGGALMWGPNGMPICTVPGAQTFATLCATGSGGVDIAWCDDRNGPFAVYAQRVDASGTHLWTTDGVLITSTLLIQGEYSITTTASGTFVTWCNGIDDVNGSDMDIYAQKLNAAGVPQWAASGIPVCADPDFQESPVAVPDLNGGVICAWRDSRNGAQDVYSERVTSAGVPYAFVVTKEVDDNTAGTLRVAIAQANADPGPQTISFDIPGPGVHTIPLTSSFPIITDALTIDGFTQPGASPNTVPVGAACDAQIMIELDGQNGSTQGFQFAAPNCTLRGVSMFGGYTPVTVTGSSAVIEGNYFGFRADGQPFPYNPGNGAFVSGLNCRIGGVTAAARNVIGGFSSGVQAAGANGLEIYGNYFGISPDLATAQQNSIGVWLTSTSGAKIGSSILTLTPNNQEANIIANDLDGVDIDGTGAVNNMVIGNSFFGTYYSAIDLGHDGPTYNDRGDFDSGPNNRQNQPVITAVSASQIDGFFDGILNQVNQIHFYRSTSCGGSAGRGNAATYIGGVTVGGLPNFSFHPAQPIPPGSFITCTATDLAGNTSELTNCIQYQNTGSGSNVMVNLVDGNGNVKGTATYQSVSASGNTFVTNPYPPSPPVSGGFIVSDPNDPSIYFDITTTASYSGYIDVCLNYDENNIPGPESSLLLVHYNGSAWEDVTTLRDVVNNKICGRVTSLSPFVIARTVTSGVGDTPVPDRFNLSANVPNPFNPITTIRYDVPRGGVDVNITIYDIAGRRVRELVKEHRAPGSWSIEWNGEDDRGVRVASGVYFYRMRAGEFVETRKMVLLK